MPRPSSNLRVFVAFKDDTVFAGEDVECTITFKNIDHAATPQHTSPVGQDSSGLTRSGDPLEQLRAARRPSQTPTPRSPLAESQTPLGPPYRRPAHNRNTSSLSIVESAAQQESKELPGGGYHIADSGPERRHQRRVSIVSLGGQAAAQRPNHGRSASVQALSNVRTTSIRPRELSGGQSTQKQRISQSPSPISPSPLSESATPPLMRPSHSRSASIQISERWVSDMRDQRPEPSSIKNQGSSPGSQQGFRFPASLQGLPKVDTAPSSVVEGRDTPFENVPFRSRPTKQPSPQNGDGLPSEEPERTRTPTNVFSLKSLEGTPRSSMDIYSTSNHSNETLTSEYPAQQSNALLQKPQLSRTSSLSVRPNPARITETLMMGYAQLSGSFTLDGSLVNSAPFEEVKRKAVVGGQAGGGVVGITQPAGDSGLFGSFRWSSIGESLGESIGGLMGGSNLSSIKEMKGIADSNAIPLLSTSKSVLFVDLKLAPGQSKSFSYRFPLPRGLPPSHKGRAITVSYNLVIGVQRPNSGRYRGQPVKQVEVPFRVFCGVNSQGESLGHDLMSPYIILKDQAQTAALDESESEKNKLIKKRATESSASAAADFQSYVNQLLTRPRGDSTGGLASPTAEGNERSHSPQPLSNGSARVPTPLSASTLIDRAVQDCSNASSPNHTPTNFTIARASIPIASLYLSRSALKLGDLMTCVLDFTNAKLPCYAFEATLESIEKVDPGLAIRSEQSVERATRKVWARTVENALWARRSTFRAQVPAVATPAFATTGVGLDWFIRLELVIGLASETAPSEMEDENKEEGPSPQAWAAPQKAERLLEVVTADERGTVLGATHRLACHSFEVTIPLRVFGAVAKSNGETSSINEAKGLVV